MTTTSRANPCRPTDELRTAGQQIGKWTAKRNELIRQAHEEGLSLRAIATAVGLSHAGVAKIVRRS